MQCQKQHYRLLTKEETMTEEEKALAGYLYDAQEESLGKERLRSQELSFDYNSLRNEITFGDDVRIGPNCGIYAAGHAFDPERRAAGIEYARPVHIGNNVWIGGHVSIVSGVTIGDNAIIAAGSVVVSDIPANVLAGGNPCRVIRTIRPEDDRKYMEV